MCDYLCIEKRAVFLVVCLKPFSKVKLVNWKLLLWVEKFFCTCKVVDLRCCIKKFLKFHKIHRKTTVSNSLLRKSRACNFVKMTLWHRCSLVSFAIYLEHLWWLLLVLAKVSGFPTCLLLPRFFDWSISMAQKKNKTSTKSGHQEFHH